MKLCVLTVELEHYSPLAIHEPERLYYIPIREFQKQLLKGNVNLDDDDSGYMCYVYVCNVPSNNEICEEMLSKSARFGYAYAEDVIKGRFILGEKSIKSSTYRIRYEELFNIKL